MKNISLNLFGEKVTIKMPTTLASLRKEISDKFMFNPSDAAEVIISYVKDLGKKLIQTEQDFANFISNQIGKLDLDISQDSRLYKEQFNSLKKESEENKKLLEECLKKDTELKKKKEETMKAEMDKLNLIESKIQKLINRKKKLEKRMKLTNKKIEKEQKQNSKKIEILKKRLNLTTPKEEPKETKPSPKKVVVKKTKTLKAPNKPENKKEVHPFATCDGCKMCPIIGKRYKCKNNPNLDFCEKCHLNKEKTKGLKFELVDTQKLMKQIILKASANRINKDGKFIHRMISCEGCGMFPIIGERFKCTICPNFNYCKCCKQMFGNIHGHPMEEVKSKFD